MISTETTEETDQQRRLRIQSSPVKSFYKTVPLDETGATDTETPRVSLSGWPTSSLYTTDVMHVLSDSLIVNAEEEPELDSNDDMKEILSMLDDDENGNPMGMLCKGLDQQQQQQGTRWHEFKSGKNRYQLPFSHNSLFVSVNDNDKNSCDASSEESDDLPTDIQSVTISTAATTPPLPVDWKHCSLKRRRKSRISTSDRLPLLFGPIIKSPTSTALGHDMEASVCSNCSQTCSEITYLNSACGSFHSVRLPRPHDSRMAFRTRHNVRRKLRVRRLPRSMSDGEHLGLRMNTSTYSAPGASAIRDSDATAPEQSDAPPYEWDDYNPPAKAEDDWEQCDGEPDDMSVLTIEDDFQMQLGDLHSLNSHFCSSIPRTYGRNRAAELRTPAKDRPPRPIAAVTGNCVPKHPNCANGNWNLDLAKIMMTAATTAATKTTNTSTNLRYRHHHHHSESDLVTLALPQSQTIISNTNSSTECSQSLPSAPSSASAATVAPDEVHSPLPAILSKIEKFASSLKLIQDDEHSSTSSSSLSTLSSIRSLGDVVSTLKIFTDIHERLVEEQEELQSFLSSDSFSGDLSGLVDEFEPLSKGYEDAIKRVEHLMAQIEAIRENWNDWAETQRNMQAIMRGIENELAQLRKGGNNSEQICSELELCQERMNRLETVCNYLTSNLASLHHDNSASAPSIDFASELALYSNALVQLRTRFENEIRPVTTAADKATWVGTRKRRHFKEQLMPKKFLEHSTAMDADEDHLVVATNIVGPAKLGWSLKAFLFIVVLAAFTAWFSNSTEISWRTTLGPHLDYVNGPPPV